MQDWIRDNPASLLKAAKTATQLRAEESMDCTTCEQQPWFSFFFDGTGNNRNLDEPAQRLLNIDRLYEGHVCDDGQSLIKQFYYPGVGVPMNTSPFGAASGAHAVPQR